MSAPTVPRLGPGSADQDIADAVAAIEDGAEFAAGAARLAKTLTARGMPCTREAAETLIRAAAVW